MINIIQWLTRLLCKGNKENKLEEYYNNKYPKADIFYKGRPIPNSKTRVSIDVRNFYNKNDALIRTIANEQINGKTDDEKTYNCLIWIIKNIKYVKDKTKGHNEFWQFPFETLYYKTGDCEDGAILLANLMITKNIPYWKIRLSAGNVVGGGHAYLTYYCEETYKWVVLDWCYYPNYLKINKRKDYKDEKKYGSVWFSWNEKYSYHSGLNTESKKVLKQKI